jgi:hypothetical protein
MSVVPTVISVVPTFDVDAAGWETANAGVVVRDTAGVGGEYGASAPIPLPGGLPAPPSAAVAVAGT